MGREKKKEKREPRGRRRGSTLSRAQRIGTLARAKRVCQELKKGRADGTKMVLDDLVNDFDRSFAGIKTLVDLHRSPREFKKAFLEGTEGE